MKLFATVLAIAGAALAAYGMDERTRVVTLFRDACLSSEISVSTSRQLAAARGWAKDIKLSRDLTSGDQRITTEVWNAAPIAGSPISVTTSIIDDAGQRTEMCAVLVRRFSDPELEQALVSTLQVRSPKRQQNNDEVQSGWELDGRPGAWVWYHSQRLTDGLAVQIGIALLKESAR